MGRTFLSGLHKPLHCSLKRNVGEVHCPRAACRAHPFPFVKHECYGEHCFGIVFDQGSGEDVNVTDGEKNKKRAYRKARKLLEEAESGDGVVSEEWLRCQQDPAACGGF